MEGMRARDEGKTTGPMRALSAKWRQRRGRQPRLEKRPHTLRTHALLEPLPAREEGRGVWETRMLASSLGAGSACPSTALQAACLEERERQQQHSAEGRQYPTEKKEIRRREGAGVRCRLESGWGGRGAAASKQAQKRKQWQLEEDRVLDGGCLLPALRPTDGKGAGKASRFRTRPPGAGSCTGRYGGALPLRTAAQAWQRCLSRLVAAFEFLGASSRKRSQPSSAGRQAGAHTHLPMPAQGRAQVGGSAW